MNNEHYTQLINYISDHLRQGFSEDIIRQTLHQHGWNAAIVENAFTSLRTPASVIPQAPQTPATPTAPVEEHYAQPSSQSAQSAPSTEMPAQAAPVQVAAVPSKYKLFPAIADTFRAIRRNFLAVFLGVVLSYVIGIAIGALVIFLMTLAIIGLNWPRPSSNIIIVYAVEIFVLLAIYVFAQTLFLVLPSLAIFDGAEGRKSRFGTLLKTSVRKIWRVAAASALLWTVAVAPVLVMFILSFGFLFGARGAGSLVLVVLTPLLALVGIALSMVLLLRYSLAPYVALFESSLPVTKTLRRSKQLLLGGGQWFLFKAMLFILLVLVVVSVLSGADVQELRNTDSLAVNIMVFIISIVTNGVVVMLYRNRRAVKG